MSIGKNLPLDEKLSKLLEQARNLPPMTEEQLWEQRISFAYGNLSLDKAEDVDRPEFEANAWKFAWRKSQERISTLRNGLMELEMVFRTIGERHPPHAGDHNAYLGEANSIKRLLEEDSKLR
jgi:hypothetical protein